MPKPIAMVHAGAAFVRSSRSDQTPSTNQRSSRKYYTRHELASSRRSASSSASNALHYDARKPRKTTAPSSLSHSASSWSKPSTRPNTVGGSFTRRCSRAGWSAGTHPAELEQIKTVETERDALLATQQVAASAPAAMLLDFKGIGPEFAAALWLEGLFRHFDNRRQIASYAGLAPTPWQSGSVDREQGVSKAGNPRLRTTLMQLAWLWLRHQPQSALALWFEQRVRRNGGRFKKTTIVALARKLLVALWKYVTAGVVIEGAVMKTVGQSRLRSVVSSIGSNCQR